jgi:type II secretory pathway pseudopilin PulG
MMITLMLALALITLAMLAVLPDLKQQMHRDREEELRHRGNSYMRAIQHFYKKLGRYPTKIEDLENTNNIRFLRKRYTDPMNIDPATHKERDFRLLHQQDISINGQVTPGSTPGASPLGGPSASGPGTGPQNLSSDDSDNSPPGNSPSGISPSGGSSLGSSSPGSSMNAGGNSLGSSSSSSSSSSGLTGQTFGGGPIIGVASTSKAKTIRVFFDKNHYNDWLFVYVPQADRGGLLTGPINPGAPAGNAGGVNPAQMQMPGGTSGPSGPGGFGSSPIGGQSQGLQPQTPQPPTQAPQQPQ